MKLDLLAGHRTEHARREYLLEPGIAHVMPRERGRAEIGCGLAEGIHRDVEHGGRSAGQRVAEAIAANGEEFVLGDRAFRDGWIRCGLLRGGGYGLPAARGRGEKASRTGMLVT